MQVQNILRESLDIGPIFLCLIFFLIYDLWSYLKKQTKYVDFEGKSEIHLLSWNAALYLWYTDGIYHTSSICISTV